MQKIQDLDELYGLPVLERSFEFWLYQNEEIALFPELGFFSSYPEDTVISMSSQNRVEVKVTHVYRNGIRRQWGVGYLTYLDDPFLVIRQPYPNSRLEEHPTKYVVDAQVYYAAIEYLNDFKRQVSFIGDPLEEGLEGFFIGKLGEITTEVVKKPPVIQTSSEIVVEGVNSSISLGLANGFTPLF